MNELSKAEISLIFRDADSYDTQKGIEKHLAEDLAGLHRLRQARMEAGYKRDERMQEWVVLGRFYLDACGNFSPCTFEIDDGEKYLKASWLPDALPRVISKDVLFTVLTKLSMTSQLRSFLPEPKDLCPECERGWSLTTCHDAVETLIEQKWKSDSLGRPLFERGFLHSRCSLLFHEKKAFTTYYHAVTQSGFAGSRLDAIPNEYSPEGIPWARVRTVHGDFKVGYRRHVFQIDWSEVVKERCRDKTYDERKKIEKAFDEGTLFSKEEVTKGPYFIHAWTEPKLVEYLTVLAGAMKREKF